MRLPSRLLPLVVAACASAPRAVRDPQTGPSTPAADDSGGPGPGGDSAAPDTGGSDTAPPPPAPPRVVLFIGDGMGLEHVAGGGLYATGARDGLGFARAPVRGRVRTASLSGLTDSAAAATTLAAGVKTWNGRIGLDAAGAPVTTVVDRARARGMATGVVTTDTLLGATPAAFLVHTESRNDAVEIAAQLAAGLPDVLLGGGRAALAPVVDRAAVQVVEDPAALAAAPADGRPLLGLLAPATLPFVVEGDPTAPPLADLATAALDRLLPDPDGFLLIVEGARIDHAAHLNRTDAVHLETAALGAAVDAVRARLDADGAPYLLLVTADHECGGLRVPETGAAGVVPPSTWRWGDHTNTEVGVYAWGAPAEVLHDAVVDNTALHAVLQAAIEGTPPVLPAPGRLADGALTDLGDPVVTQAWPTDFGAGWNQLDALRVTTDATGLWVGIDGVFDDDANAVLVLIDLDPGAGTGLGAGLTLADPSADLDALLSDLAVDVAVPGVGFDAALASVAVSDVRRGAPLPTGGLRLFAPPHGTADDLWWMDAAINHDFSRVARGGPAAAAGPTGVPSGAGLEAVLPWESLFPDGLPADGAALALVAALVQAPGGRPSNQALPPFPSGAAPAGPLPVRAVVTLAVDATGALQGAPAVLAAE